MLLDKLNIDNDVEENEDFLPGDFTKDTAMYPMTVDMAYLGESAGGAVSVTLHLKEIGGNGGHRETFYVTSKTGSNTYVDKRSGNKRLLPGMDAMNQLSLITAGKKLPAQTAEEKIVKVWNFDEKKELPTPVQALTEMIGEEVLVALVKKRDNKTQKVGNEYVRTPEEKIFNEVGKFLYPSGHTVAEKIAEQEETTYRDSWVKKFPPDYVQDKYQTVGAGKGVEAASAAAGATNAGKVDDLFDEDDTPETAETVQA
jgi:hypothetical protein